MEKLKALLEVVKARAKVIFEAVKAIVVKAVNEILKVFTDAVNGTRGV